MKLCKRDHEMTDENTYVNPSTGSLLCRECRRLIRLVRRGWLMHPLADPEALFDEEES